MGKGVIGLSEGRQKVVRKEILDHIGIYTNMVQYMFHDKLLLEGCTNKITTQRLSRDLKVVIGLS